MRWFVVILAIAIPAGCQSVPPVDDSAARINAIVAAVVATPVQAPTTRPTLTGSVSLVGDIQNPGRRDLHNGEKISDVLRGATLASPATKLTLVLVRRCPEGTTSEMIDLDQNLQVVDALRDVILRDGDELVVSVVAVIPEGLARPTAAAVPTH